MTSAAAPPAPVLARMADYGIEVSALGWGMASLASPLFGGWWGVGGWTFIQVE